MKNFILKLKQIWHKNEKSLVKRIWYDEKRGEIFIHAYCRSGLFYLPIKKGEQNSCWVADIWQTKGLSENETIYRLVRIENKTIIK